LINIPKNRSATGDGPGRCIEPGAGRPWATTLRHRDRDHGDVLAGNDGFLKSIDTAHVVGLRHRALIGLMVYAFARISAVVSLKVEDYFPLQKRWWLRL
jgi:hypothetical protein